MKTPSELIRACYHAYETKDRGALEPLLADNFTFSSPLDDNISRETYFERCWPNSDHVESIKVEKLFVDGDEAFAQYVEHAKGQPEFRNTEFFTIRDGKIAHVDVYFGTEVDTKSTAEADIRRAIESWAEALRRKDVEGVMKHFAQNSVRFELAPPLQTNMPLRENLESWFATFRGDIGYEIRDLVITTAADLAYCHSFNRIAGTKVDGEHPDVWVRETLCLREVDGRWLITHMHESVPFYMDGSVKAAIDLKPE
jgi:ketosteroid isomerase-like protein